MQATTKSLEDWKVWFRAQFDGVQNVAVLSDAERDELIAFVKIEAEEIFSCPI